MRVLWLANIPSPYSVSFFNELGRLCELTVLFELSGASNRDKSWKEYRFINFSGIHLKGKQYASDKAFCPEVTRYLIQRYNLIVVSNMPTLTGILSITYMNIKNIPYVLQGDGGFKKDQKGVREKMKKYLISRAQYYLSTGKDHDEYYIAYGADPRLIFRIPFTSVYEKDVLAEPIKHSDKQKLREELSIEGEKVILSVGQFIHRKGFDILLKAAKKLGNDVLVYIVGGKPTTEYRSIIEEGQIKNVHFLEFMLREKLHKFYQAADLFVLPTREDIWGLVVNEAMSQGLPVVTTSRCIAGREMIEEGRNGYLVPIEDSDALAEAIRKVLQADNYDDLCTESLKKCRAYTIENSAKAHYEIFERINRHKTC